MNIRQRKSERHKEVLRKLSQHGGNKSCFDCGMRGPLYVVSDFCILVCSGCSAVHRSFQHKVKGITMSEFTDEEVARVSVSGNEWAHKVWLSTFCGQLPRSGDVIALKKHVRTVFEERLYWNAEEFSLLKDSWEHASAQSSQMPPVLSVTRPAASSLTSPPKAPMAQPEPDPVSAPTNPAGPPPNDVFDDLFSAPVHSSPTPQSTVQTAETATPLLMSVTASQAPDPPAPQKPETVTSIVADLFAGVPSPAVQPAGGYGALHSLQQQQQQFMGHPIDGIMYNFTRGSPSSMMPLTQLQSSKLPYQQQQPKPMPYAASGPTGCAPCVGSEHTSTFHFAALSAPASNAYTYEEQQQQHTIGLFGTSETAAPYSAPAQPQSHAFESGAPSTTAYQPSPFVGNSWSQQADWSGSQSSNAPPILNQNRIVILSVTQQQNDGLQNSQPKWT
ncbi:ADP-ribosylation factor GTPase activating protein, putative [Leishmania tarentolae]|uniref:ADP-ribosylation factor GTPase activating protein, putative n=1 Tax=Leishmania tarentolae TaxID=5689 RepID=A0A640KUY0_LEITA|nr:ADP-ribosylation factor GTPase activating protein, putative [Leishmania tarentolae]